MTATVPKFVAYGLTGTKAGMGVSKVVGYVVLQPGTEGGGSATPSKSFSYAQILNKPNPLGAR